MIKTFSAQIDERQVHVELGLSDILTYNTGCKTTKNKKNPQKRNCNENRSREENRSRVQQNFAFNFKRETLAINA